MLHVSKCDKITPMATDQLDPVRRTGSKAALVLEHLAKDRRRSVVVSRDRPWLLEITRHPHALLERMNRAQLLYRVNRGHYVVAPRGSFSPAQAAPVDLMAGLVLSSQGDYYFSFLSGLIAHRLTDLHSDTLYAAIRQKSTFRETSLDLPGGSLQVVRLSDSRWPQDDREVARVRALRDSKEFVWQATLERALVDALARPDLSAGIETVIQSWARAKRQEVDWELVCAIASRHGSGMARRVAFVLRLVGLHTVAAQNFPALTGRGANTPLDRSNSFELNTDEMRRDRETGVLINVPEDHLLGWVGAGELP
jgi:predicted transcriptional regulator of viral defense system